MTREKVITGAKTRVVRNYATTILGLAVWVYTFILLHQATRNGQDLQAAATALWPYMGLGTLLLRSKDSLIGLPAKD
jgi:hypothetical protein